MLWSHPTRILGIRNYYVRDENFATMTKNSDMEKKRNYEPPLMNEFGFNSENGFAISGNHNADCESVSETNYQWS